MPGPQSTAASARPQLVPTSSMLPREPSPSGSPMPFIIPRRAPYKVVMPVGSTVPFTYDVIARVPQNWYQFSKQRIAETAHCTTANTQIPGPPRSFFVAFNCVEHVAVTVYLQWLVQTPQFNTIMNTTEERGYMYMYVYCFATLDAATFFVQDHKL